MGYDDRPDSDDCIIAVDLGTGDFCYDRILAENPQARAGAVICLDKISEFIRTRTSVDGMVIRYVEYELELGARPVDVFRSAGVGPEVIGRKRIERCVSRWRRQAAKERNEQ